MPTAMNFTSLVDEVAKYLERGGAADPDVRAQIPTCVNYAERRMARDLKIEGVQMVAANTMTIGVSVYPKPDRWRDTISINFGTGTGNKARTPIYARSYEYCRNIWPDESVTGQPRFYADYDNDHFLIAPTPNQAYPFELLYHGMPPLLDETNQTNWLTQYVPQMLLYATLWEVALFCRSFDQTGVWQKEYQTALGAINGEEVRKMADRAATRQGA